MLEKCVLTILELNWNQRLGHFTWRRRKNENVFKMSKDVTCTCKACQNTVFHCQICKFMGFLLPSSSWLLKFPTDLPIHQRLLISKVLANYCGTWRFTHSLIFMSRIATQTHMENDILYIKCEKSRHQTIFHYRPDLCTRPSQDIWEIRSFLIQGTGWSFKTL